MKVMLIVFFVVLFFILIFIFPFKTRLMAHLNLIDFKGFYSFKSGRIKLLCGMIYKDDFDEIVIDNSANIFSKNKKSNKSRQMLKEMIERFELKKVELYFTGGFVQNSAASALMCGTVSTFVQVIYSILSQKFFDVRLIEDIEPTFDETNLELTFDIVVSLSLFQIIVSCFKGLKNSKLEG